MHAYDKIIEKEDKGEEPMYRPRNWKKKERENKKKLMKDNWFRRNGEESVLFVTATPRSELKRAYEEVIRKNGKVNIRIVEKGGAPLIKKLKRNETNQTNECDCIICHNNKEKGKCKQESVIYSIKCDECGDTYIGETSRNSLCRIKEHMSAYNNTTKDSVLVRHEAQKSHENPGSYTTKIMKQYRDDPLRRQTAEEYYIQMNGSINKQINQDRYE